MIAAPYSYRQRDPLQPRVHVFDAARLPWQDTPDPGLRLKPLRYDDERGMFLGLVSFAPMARSGLHQHRGVATSFVVDGGLTDYHGSIDLHQVGINLIGATHDAIAYRQTLLVSRLEGPVFYPSEPGQRSAPEAEQGSLGAARGFQLSGLHAGSRCAEIVNQAPDAPPEINVAVDALPALETGIAGLRRQTIFDYAGTGSAHRMVQLALRPGSSCPSWCAGGLTELWVRGGLLEIDGRTVHANSFVVIEPGAQLRMSSPYGALLLAWAEAPEDWTEAVPDHGRTARCSLFGF